MNRTGLYAGACAAMLALCPAGEIGAQQVLTSKATVQGARITRTEDSVKVVFRMAMDGMDVKSNRSVVLTPVLEGKNESRELPAVEVMGRRRHLYYLRNDRQTYANPVWQVVEGKDRQKAVVDYAVTLPYSPWMDGAELRIGEDLCGCGERDGMPKSPALAVADFVFKPVLAYVRPKAETAKTRELTGEAYLDFPVNRTEIHPDYRRNPEELKRIHATIDTIRNDKDFSITRIWLKGYASPEGTYANNTRLAKGRTEALKSHIRSYYGFSDDVFSTASEPENWEGLRKYVEGGSLPGKEGILALIASDEAPDPKEARLKRTYPEQYRQLLADCYPGLRRTDYRVDYVIRGFNAEEAKALLYLRPQNLSLGEMYAVADTYEVGSKEFCDVFAVAARMHPEAPEANLNAANALLEQGKAEDALPYLEKAGQSPEADNARGVAAMLQWKYKEAKALFQKAADAGVEAAKKNLERMNAQ